MMEILKWIWRQLENRFVGASESVNAYNGTPLVILVDSNGNVTAFRSKLNNERANESIRKLTLGLRSTGSNWEIMPGKISNLQMTAVKK